LQNKYFPLTFPWPLKFPTFSSFPWPVGTLQFTDNHPGQLSLAIPPWVGSAEHIIQCSASYNQGSDSVNWCLAEG